MEKNNENNSEAPDPFSIFNKNNFFVDNKEINIENKNDIKNKTNKENKINEKENKKENNIENKNKIENKLEIQKKKENKKEIIKENNIELENKEKKKNKKENEENNIYETPNPILNKPKLNNTINNDFKEILQIRCDKCYKIPSIEIIPTKKEIIICSKCDCGQKHFDLDSYEKNLTKLSLNKIPCSSLIHQNNNEENQIYSSEYCLLCKKYLCPNCVISHREFQGKHKTFKINDIDNLCPINNERLIGLCKTCKRCYCKICIKEHLEHKIKDFEKMKISEDDYFNLFSCLGKIKENMDYNEKLKNDIIKFYKEKIILIERSFQDNNKKNKKLYNLLKQILLDYSSYKNDLNFNVIKNIQFNCDFNFKTLDLNFNSSTLDEITNKSLSYFQNYIIIKKEINNNYLSKIKTIKLSEEPINSLILLKDKRIALSSLDSKIIIINPNKNYQIDLTIDNYSNGVRDICESSEGYLLASYGNLNSSIKIFQLEENSFRKIGEIYNYGYFSKILQIKFNNYIAAGSFDHTIKMYNIKKSTKEVFTLTGNKNLVSSLLEIKEKNYLISVSHDNTLRFWDLESMKQIHLIDNICCTQKDCLVQVNYNQIAVGCSPGVIKVISVHNFEIINSITCKLPLCLFIFNEWTLISGNNDKNNDNNYFSCALEIIYKRNIIFGNEDGEIKIYEFHII